MIPLNANLDGLTYSAIRRFTNLAKQTPGCTMLTLGEPDFSTPPEIVRAGMEALRQGRTHYAPNWGTDELRQDIAAFETARGMPCDPSQVLVTAGATGALFTLLLGVLNPGDEVIIPTPAFSLYETIVTVAGGKPVFLDTTPGGYQIPREELERMITDRTKAIIINSPNNPTGCIYSRESLMVVRDLALKHGFYVVCDNVYSQLSYGPCPDLTLCGELREQLFLCQSFSKPYAMTGWRVGYLIGPVKILERLLLLHAAELACVPTFVQDACRVALKTDVSAMRESYRVRRGYVCRRLEEMGLPFTEPMGAFYVFPQISQYGLSDEEFCTRIIQEGGVAVTPGTCFRGEGHIRISYCYSPEELETSLNRLEQFIHTL